jgi:predicted nucleic acid-binding protein
VKQYVLDANAIMRFLEKGPGFDCIGALFRLASRGEARLLMSVVNRGEVLYSLARRAGIHQASEALTTLSGVMELADVHEEEANAAALLKLRYKMGFADCFAAELAMRMGATLVTADPDFVKIGKRLKVLALPRHSK